MKKLAPSILSADYKNIIKDLEELENCGVDMIHIDIMDGQFVPNFSFGLPMLHYIRERTSMFMDVHLMMYEPLRFLEQIKSAGVDVVTIHMEACSEPFSTLKKIKSLGMNSGIALSPETSERLISDEIFEVIDIIHLMSVAPGVGNQKFLPEILEKIKNTQKLIKEKNSKVLIEVDGDINFENLEEVCKAGTDIVVCGKALFSGNLKENVKRFQVLVKNIESKENRYAIFNRN